MTTPARRHKMRVLAELAAKAAGPGEEVRGGAYELMLAQLHEHRRTLKAIQSVERKIEAKRSFVGQYDESLGRSAASTVSWLCIVIGSWHSTYHPHRQAPLGKARQRCRPCSASAPSY